MITVVLIEPEHPGNIGAIARAMANFDLNKLVLVNPKVKIDQDARNRAKHAQKILNKAKIIKTKKDNVFDALQLKKFDYLIGTTAKIGTDFNIPRCPLTPEELANRIAKLNLKKKKLNIALIFGREGHGLFNKEIEKCDFIVTIPTSKKYETMNLSHSASVIFYELFKATGKNRIKDKIIMATSKEKNVLLKYINAVLDKVKFPTKDKKVTQKKTWKRVIGKAFLTKREAFALCGFFRKLKFRKLKKKSYK